MFLRDTWKDFCRARVGLLSLATTDGTPTSQPFFTGRYAPITVGLYPSCYNFLNSFLKMHTFLYPKHVLSYFFFKSKLYYLHHFGYKELVMCFFA